MNEPTLPGPNVQFTGAIPDLYDRHLGPLLFASYAADLVERVATPSSPNSAVLEVAAGTGIVTEQLREHLPRSVRLISTDLNEPMLAVARERLRRSGRAAEVTVRAADAMSLPFDDASFNVVVCQFGVMFFPDKPRAAAESFRVLRPMGQWLFNVWGSWDENPFGRIVHETVASFFSHDAPQFYRVPFSFSNPVALRALVTTTGFECRDIVTLDRTCEAASAATAAIGLVAGNPLATAIRERGEVSVEEVTTAVAERLATEYGDHPMRIPTRIRVVDARRTAR